MAAASSTAPPPRKPPSATLNVIIGAGTLYGVFTTLEKQALIEKVREEDRRKIYALTDKSRHVLEEQVRHMTNMLRNGELALALAH